MDIVEIKKLKTEMEADILYLLNQFNERTSLNVEFINLAKTSELGSPKDTVCNVKCFININ